MIIKNNFNEKSVNPLDNYTSVGKGSHSLEKELEREKEGFIKANMDDKVLEDLRTNHDDTIDESGDNWKLFR